MAVNTTDLFFKKVAKNTKHKLKSCSQNINKQKCKAYLTKNAKFAILFLQSKLYKNRKGAKMRTKIAQLRKERKISQEELAQAVGVTRQTITSIEVEKYTASLVLAYKIAQFFGKSIEEVFDFSDT